MSFKDKLLAFVREEEGLTAVEYAVAGGLVSLAVVAAFTTLGTSITARIERAHHRDRRDPVTRQIGRTVEVGRAVQALPHAYRQF